jgi:hypothetical protein
MKIIKDLKERFTETQYFYVVMENKEVIIEFTDKETAQGYAKAFEGIIYDYLPYEKFGFSDPYTFINTWVFLNDKGEIIEYIYEQDTVKEVPADVI